MIKELEWDSDFWNLKIADCIYESDKEIIDFLKERHVDIIQTQVDINKTEVIRKLERINFKFIDLNVEYTLSIENNKETFNPYNVANQNNVGEIESIASQVFDKSRYNIIDTEKTKEFYRLWSKKAVLGEFDDVCLIEKDEQGKISGFITIRRIDEVSAKIGLIGVNPKHQNKSMGTNLISQAKNYLSLQGVKILFVSTQGSNIKAQQFYVKNGFNIYSISVWLYRFLSDG
jgi:dTDP-4-amino-4,6-dideoxy-D-galactose acyltransferase